MWPHSPIKLKEKAEAHGFITYKSKNCMKLKEFPGKRVPQEPSRWTVTKENNVDKMQNSKYANRKIQTFLRNPPSNTIKKCEI